MMKLDSFDSVNSARQITRAAKLLWLQGELFGLLLEVAMVGDVLPLKMNIDFICQAVGNKIWIDLTLPICGTE